MTREELRAWLNANMLREVDIELRSGQVLRVYVEDCGETHFTFWLVPANRGFLSRVLGWFANPLRRCALDDVVGPATGPAESG